jgi:2,4-dienoyl-CoA reductase-like NADH-dependent reductase (Old Yellow Enzyme family)
MSTVENSQVDYPIGKNSERQLTIHSDEALPGLKQLCACLHDNGALAAIQIHHAGRETTLEVTGGLKPVAPSAVSCPHLQTPVREMTRKEIYQVIGDASSIGTIHSAIHGGYAAVHKMNISAARFK